MVDRETATTSCNNAIIARIRSRPEMWSFSHPQYKHRKRNLKFWHDLSKELGYDEGLLRKRWKHLKDQYRKELKRSIEKGLSSEDVVWQYFESLHFLRDEITRDKAEPPSRSPNWQAEAPAASEDDSEEDSKDNEIAKKVRVVEVKTDMIYTGLMETKAAIEERLNPVDDVSRNDPDYMYLMSLLPTLKQLSQIQKLQLKGRINDWLLEAYLGGAVEEQESKYLITPHMPQ